MTRRRERRAAPFANTNGRIICRNTRPLRPVRGGSHHPLISPHHYAVPERHIGPRDESTPSERVKCMRRAWNRRVRSSRGVRTRPALRTQRLVRRVRLHVVVGGHVVRHVRVFPRRVRGAPRGVLRWIHLPPSPPSRPSSLPFDPVACRPPRRVGAPIHTPIPPASAPDTPRRRPGAPPRATRHGGDRPRARQRQHRRPHLLALTVGMVGVTYASVPLYRMFCQATGFGGTTRRRSVEEKLAHASALPASVRDAPRTAR